MIVLNDSVQEQHSKIVEHHQNTRYSVALHPMKCQHKKTQQTPLPLPRYKGLCFLSKEAANLTLYSVPVISMFLQIVPVFLLGAQYPCMYMPYIPRHRIVVLTNLECSQKPNGSKLLYAEVEKKWTFFFKYSMHFLFSYYRMIKNS